MRLEHGEAAKGVLQALLVEHDATPRRPPCCIGRDRERRSAILTSAREHPDGPAAHVAKMIVITAPDIWLSVPAGHLPRPSTP
jgi:hypothetical protein